MSMRILMIAPPGAGKGTQGALIAAHFHIPHIATGELLRDHVARQTALGQAVQAYLDRGELVPDQIVLDMTREAIIAAKAAHSAAAAVDPVRGIVMRLMVQGTACRRGAVRPQLGRAGCPR